MARLYADEDFSYPVIQRLRQLGHDILTLHHPLLRALCLSSVRHQLHLRHSLNARAS